MVWGLPSIEGKHLLLISFTMSGPRTVQTLPLPASHTPFTVPHPPLGPLGTSSSDGTLSGSPRGRASFSPTAPQVPPPGPRASRPAYSTEIRQAGATIFGENSPTEHWLNAGSKLQKPALVPGRTALECGVPSDLQVKWEPKGNLPLSPSFFPGPGTHPCLTGEQPTRSSPFGISGSVWAPLLRPLDLPFLTSILPASL